MIEIAATVCIETTVDHSRMMQIMDIHPRDLSTLFSELVDKGCLFQEGSGRGTVYFMDQARFVYDVKEKFNFIDTENVTTSGGKETTSGGSGSRSGGMGHKKLIDLASKVAETKRVSRDVMIETVLKLCAINPLVKAKQTLKERICL